MCVGEEPVLDSYQNLVVAIFYLAISPNFPNMQYLGYFEYLDFLHEYDWYA